MKFLYSIYEIKQWMGTNLVIQNYCDLRVNVIILTREMKLIQFKGELLLFLSLFCCLLMEICSIPLSSVYCPANAGTGANYNSCQSCD